MSEGGFRMPRWVAGFLIAHAINDVLTAPPDGRCPECCPTCCGPCKALAWLAEYEPDSTSESVAAASGTGWHWQLPGGHIDWAQLQAAWSRAPELACHGEEPK